jgi:hypothetical protein cdivTM_02973
MAHLYEHMVMNQLKRQACQANLLRQIDYFALGTHYSGAGFITIDLDLYTTEATSLMSALGWLHVQVSDAALQLAMQQIAAETGQVISCNDPAQLKKDIAIADNATWQQIEKISQPITIAHPAERSYLCEVARSDLSISQVSYTLKKPLPNNPALLPLFHYLASAVHSTVADLASYQLGYYLGDRFTKTHSHLLSTTTFTVLSHRVNDTTVRQMYHDTLVSMLEEPTLSRIIRRLASFSYSDGHMDVPDIDTHILELGAIIGESTWRQLATKEIICSLFGDVIVNYIAPQ